MTKMLKKVNRWLNERNQVKRTVKELSALSDRDLSDIGINRSEIYRVAREDIILKSNY